MPAIRINRKALVSLLQELIKINSVNPLLSSGGTGEADISRYIGGYLKKLGLTVAYQEIQKGRINVIGILKGAGGGQTLMLNGHTDTVSVENMTIDPFEARLKEGRLYGRGALDMKAGVAAQISAIQTLIESGIKLKGLDVFFFRPAFEMAPDQPIVQCVRRAFESTCNRNPEFKGMWAWLDSAILAQAGIPTVIFGPSGDGAHAAVEYVDVDSVITTTQVLFQTIMDFCNP